MTISVSGPRHRDLFWSGIGTLLPAVAALWAVPHYTAVLGAEGFGLLALVWSLVGWFSVTDLGLSRAVTQGVARALATDDADGASAVVWSALGLMVPVSLVVGVVVVAVAPWAVGHLHIDVTLASDATTTLRWVGVAVPLTVVVTALRGVVEGAGAFRLLALVRAPLGIAFAVLPLWFLRGDAQVASAVEGVVAVRAAAVIVHVLLALRVLPALRLVRFVDRTQFLALLTFGGWNTLVSTVGPLLNQLDRLLLGILAPMAVLAPYGVASEAGTRIWLLAAVILPVQYAWFAGRLATSPADAVRSYARGLRLLALSGLPILLVAAVVADPLMAWWVGPSLGPSTASLFTVLAIGLMANLVAQGTQTFLQAAGQPIYTALGYLWQLPVTALALVLVVPRVGAIGAAWVCTSRFVIDALWHAWAAERAVPAARAVRQASLRAVLIPVTLLTLVLVIRWVSAG